MPWNIHPVSHCSLSQAVQLIYTVLPMPHRLWPICRIQGRLLQAPSRDAFVEYYHCDTCGHIWTHVKSNPDTPAKDITIRSQR